MIRVIKNTDIGADVILMKNENIELYVTNYGCTIMSMYVRDKNNEMRDVVLGFPAVEDCAKRDGTYLGALVGRVANRIGKGEFTLNGETYKLAINNGPNTLHGGLEGFSYKIFDYKIRKDEVLFHCVSPDGEENFSGKLDFYASYELLENGL